MAGSNDLVAVVTRTKDRPLLLRRALLSVKNQTYENHIHILVNDNGDENTIKDVLRELHITPIDARLITINSGGHMEATSNAGLEIAKELGAKFVVIHDDDDSWSSDFLSVMTSELSRYQELAPSVAGIICRANRVYEKIDGNTITVDHFEPHATILPEVGILDVADLFDDKNNFAPIQFLYELRAWVELDGYNPQLTTYGDWDFNLRFLEKYDIAAIPNYLAFYHWRLTSTGVDSNSIVGKNYQKETCRQVVLNRLQRKYGNVSIYSKIAQIQTELQKLGEKVDALQQNKKHTAV